MLTAKGVARAITVLENNEFVLKIKREALAQGWLTSMADMSDDELLAAVLGYINSEDAKYGWPKAGTLRGHLRVIASVGTTPALTGQQAWAVVYREMERYNPHGGARIEWPENPKRFKAICRMLGGIAELSRTPLSDIPFRARDFERAWNAEVADEERERQGNQVLSLADARRDRKALTDRGGR